MSYNYSIQKSRLFTEEGMKLVIKIRDNAKKLIKQSGAAMSSHLFKDCTGDSWDFLAAIDYLVENKELLEIPNTFSPASQHRIFTNFDWQ